MNLLNIFLFIILIVFFLLGIYFYRKSISNQQSKTHYILLERENAEQVLSLKENILQAMDSLSLAMAFYDGQKEKVMFNSSFGKFIGGKEKGEAFLWEIPLLGTWLRKEESLQVIEVGSLKLHLRIWGGENDKVVFLEDIGEKERKSREMNYLSTALWHELRTPLTALEGNVVILEEEVKDQFLLDISYKMEQQINRIETTLDNLRQLTSIFQEENQFSTAGELKRTLEEVINNFEDDIRRLDLSLSVDTSLLDKVKAIFPFSSADFLILFSNLFSNALKFNYPKGRAEIKLNREEEGVFLELSNTTSNTSREFIKWLFEPSSTFSPRGADGRGVGLYLAKEAVARMGGRISAHYGEGDSVIFRVLLCVEDKNEEN